MASKVPQRYERPEVISTCFHLGVASCAIRRILDCGYHVVARLLPLSNVSEAVRRLSGEIDALDSVNDAGTLVDANRSPSEARGEDIKSTFEVNLSAFAWPVHSHPIAQRSRRGTQCRDGQ